MSATWKDFLPEIGAPNGVAGYLDWSTGMLRVNSPYDVWNRISQSEDPTTLEEWERDVVETVTHETIHFLQITTTGFLYKFAVELFDQIKSCIPFPVRDFSEIPKKAPPLQAEKIRDHLAILDNEGENSVTLRSLVECQAILTQMRTHWKGLTHEGFLQKVYSLHLPKEYSQAYVTATNYLGPNAFDSYPFVSSMALCASNPVSAFHAICRGIYETNITDRPINAIDQYTGLLNQLYSHRKIELIGTSAEVLNRMPEHPVYTPMVLRLNELCGQQGISILEYFAAPHEIKEPVAIAVARPTMFNSDSAGKWYIHVPTNWRPDLDTSSKDSEAEFLVFLMSVATPILRNL